MRHPGREIRGELRCGGRERGLNVLAAFGTDDAIQLRVAQEAGRHGGRGGALGREQ